MAEWAPRLPDAAPFAHVPCNVPMPPPPAWDLQPTEERWGGWHLWDAAVARVVERASIGGLMESELARLQRDDLTSATSKVLTNTDTTGLLIACCDCEAVVRYPAPGWSLIPTRCPVCRAAAPDA